MSRLFSTMRHGPTESHRRRGSVRTSCPKTPAICLLSLVIMAGGRAAGQDGQSSWSVFRPQDLTAASNVAQPGLVVTPVVFETPTTFATPQEPETDAQLTTPGRSEAVAADTSSVTMALRDSGSNTDFVSALPDQEVHLVQFVEILQWTVVVLLIAVVAALGLKKYSRGRSMMPTRNSGIAHLATVPVKNHFQAHLLEVGTQRFLVTTDRTGVKTVNAVNNWADFSPAIEESHAADAVPLCEALS